MLTRKQRELLLFINQRLTDTGVSPSFDEMKEALDLRSKSGIHRLITALEERGFLKRLPHRARALEVLRLPDEAATARAAPKFQPSVVTADFSRGRAEPPTDAASRLVDQNCSWASRRSASSRCVSRCGTA